MSTNPEIDETKILKIQTLKNEYDITLKQYQEAMKTYINDLSLSESDKNECNKYKITDKNISQICYDKIWHDQGCLTDTPAVDASKTLDELVLNSYKSSSTEKDKDLCYGNPNATLNSSSLPTYPLKKKFEVIEGKTWWGTGELKSQILETEDECIALCDSDINCSGATFNPTKKSCWTRKGNSSITDGLKNDPTQGSDYAIVKRLKYEMSTLKTLNSKLLKLNEDITNEIKKNDSSVENYENIGDIKEDELRKYREILIQHRDEIKNQLNDYEDIEAEYNNSSLYVKQQHWMYNIFALVSLIIVFITIKKLLEGDNTVGVFILIGFVWALYIFIIKFTKNKK